MTAKLKRKRTPGVTRRTRAVTRRVEDEHSPLTAAQHRQLEAQIRYMKDRSRFLLVSTIGGRIVLYYDVTSDTYVMDDPRSATLFKRRAVAAAVMRCLGKGIEVRACKVDRADNLIVSSIAKSASRKRPR